jgi:hypothetical protein
MSLEILFVHRDVLYGNDATTRLMLDDGVDKE